jgi:signal transduction histidine kinase
MAEEIESEQPGDSLSAQNARDIVMETQRLGELVNHFLSLSRAPKSNAAVTTVEVGEEIMRVVQLMRKSAPLRVKFETDLLSTPLTVSAEERALRQLLLNLLINASEAVEQQNGGTIVVQAREKKQHVEIRVRDTGPGMSSKELSRAFEPFFTTKKSGTGLGLALCRGIVENLGGTLTLESSTGKGTTAILTLPRTEPTAPKASIR